MSNKSRAVKWIAEDGGWRTGQTLCDPSGHEIIWWDKGVIRVQVRESCDGRISWPQNRWLLPWASREEWEGERKWMAVDERD